MCSVRLTFSVFIFIEASDVQRSVSILRFSLVDSEVKRSVSLRFVLVDSEVRRSVILLCFCFACGF